MRHKQEGDALGVNPLDRCHAFLLEKVITNTKCLVDDQHIGFQKQIKGKREPEQHSRGIYLDRHVKKVADISERLDLSDSIFRVVPGKAEQFTAGIDILASGKFKIESGTKLEQAEDATVGTRAAERGLHYTRNDFQQSALA